MIPLPVSIDSGESIGDEISWGAGQDSYYEVPLPLPSFGCVGQKVNWEYLLKVFLLWPNERTGIYRDTWLEAVESTMRNLSSRSLLEDGEPGHLFLAMQNRRKTNEMGQYCQPPLPPTPLPLQFCGFVEVVGGEYG